MRDDWRRIELARTKEARHLVPGLVHPASDDSINGETLEDYFLRQIDLDRLDGDSKHLYPAAHSDHRKSLMNSGGHARHLEDYVDSQPIGRGSHDSLHLIGRDGVVCAHLLCELQARLVDVRCNDARRAGRPADPDGKNTNRPAPRNKNSGAGYVRGECGVKRVSHGIVNAAYVIADGVVEMPDVGGRHGNEFGEAPVAVDADDFRVRTDVSVPGATEQTPAVHDVPLGRDAIAFLHVGHESSNIDDVSRELVSHDERWLAPPSCPVVPVVNVYVRPADSGAPNADQYFILSDLRLGHVAKNDSRSCRFLHEGFHWREVRCNPCALCGSVPRIVRRPRLAFPRRMELCAGHRATVTPGTTCSHR